MRRCSQVRGSPAGAALTAGVIRTGHAAPAVSVARQRPSRSSSAPRRMPRSPALQMGLALLALAVHGRA
eukprot:2623233-Pyramimonas_sp.AAC.1